MTFFFFFFWLCFITLNHKYLKVFQHRNRTGKWVNFYTTWNAYKRGFGDFNTEFWLGHDSIHLLTHQKNYTLLVDITKPDGRYQYAEISSFFVASESENYTLTAEGYAGNLSCKLLSSEVNLYVVWYLTQLISLWAGGEGHTVFKFLCDCLVTLVGWNDNLYVQRPLLTYPRRRDGPVLYFTGRS